MYRTELDDLVVLSWKLADLGSDTFETYTKGITIPKESLYDSFYLLKTCERIVVAFLCSSDSHLPNLTHCDICSSKKNCIGRDLIEVTPNLIMDATTYSGIQAFRYLSIVASSLDSSTIGEPEILGQFKKAFVSQHESKTLFGTLYEIIVFAYKAGKKVHTSSDIPKGRISILSNAEKIFHDWIQSSHISQNHKASIAIIGTGKMGRDAYKYFKKKFLDIRVFSRNRNDFNAQDINMIYESYDLFVKDLNNNIFDVLVLCSSTNSPYITSEVLNNKKNLLIFDLGVPKNADSNIMLEKDIKNRNIQLYQMDELVQLSERNYSKRTESLNQAYEIIDDQVLYISQVFERRVINPFIKDLRIDLESVAKKRLDDYSNNKELPVEFYKWFNNTIKEMMHVSQQHLEKGINVNKNSIKEQNDRPIQDFRILSDLKPNNQNKTI